MINRQLVGVCLVSTLAMVFGMGMDGVLLFWENPFNKIISFIFSSAWLSAVIFKSKGL